MAIITTDKLLTSGNSVGFQRQGQIGGTGKHYMSRGESGLGDLSTRIMVDCPLLYLPTFDKIERIKNNLRRKKRHNNGM